MSAVTVEKSELNGRVCALPSKSFAHRILICSAFADRPVRVKGVGLGEDVQATLRCLSALGASVAKDGDCYTVTPVKHAKSALLNCGESGSTLRFMLAVCSALGGEYTFVGEGRLPQRPNLELVDALRKHGVKVSADTLPITVQGKLSGGEFVLNGGVSSQYLTGLLLSAPLTGENVKISLNGELSSAGYIDITLAVMRAFGVQVEVNGGSYFIKGGQKYVSPNEITVEGDWSNSAFLIAGGLLCGRVEVEGLLPNSVQGDMAVLDVIKRLGGNVRYEKGVYVAEKSCLTGAKFNVENIIDATPILAMLCATAKGESEICGVERLRYKESDRLLAIIEALTAIGVRAHTDGKTLWISGADKLKRCIIDGKNDHRIVMSATILGGYAGGVKIDGAQAVAKSYPTFFEDYRSLGGVFEFE